MTFRNVHTVFLDLDDTLWENNLFFLQSLDWLHRATAELGHTRRAATAVLNAHETINIPRKGFGYGSYEASLLAAVSTIVARSGRHEMHAPLRRQALKWTHFLRNHPIQWCPGVGETLPALCEKFPVIVVTKGHPPDQLAKVDRSGMRHIFRAVEVVPHKYPQDYTRLLEKYSLDPSTTVMVGNSPKSDINMARRAGLRTVYIPHAQTWYREMEPIESADPPTITIGRFDELLSVIEP